ncbi:MAG TPA: acylphosphatase [Usitatibacter sp.]|nr:acylphosphatase [Usitatibacter sp.]
MSDKVTKGLRITGHVQGVFFRESMRLEADRLGVTGWVCNRADGSVEATVQGSSDAIDAIVRWAHRGPGDARVVAVEVSEAVGEFARFEKRSTF